MVYRESITVQSNDKVCTFHNVTQQAKEALRESGIQNGIVVVYSHHTTCSVITQESAFDLSMTGLETLQQDLVNVMERIIPTQRCEGMYLHPGPKALVFAEEHGEDNRGCHNTDAHLRSSIIGRSQTIVVVPTVPDLSGVGQPTWYRRDEILKAVRMKYPTDAFTIYPDRKGYIAINAYDWLEDESLYVYVSQEEELAAFTDFFVNRYAKK